MVIREVNKLLECQLAPDCYNWRQEEQEHQELFSVYVVDERGYTFGVAVKWVWAYSEEEAKSKIRDSGYILED